MEDNQIDAYYQKIALESATRENEQLARESEAKKQSELQAQAALLAQIKDKESKLSQRQEEKEREAEERLQREEKLRFEAFKESYEENERRKKQNELLAEPLINPLLTEEVRKRTEGDEMWKRQLELDEQRIRDKENAKKVSCFLNDHFA